MKTQSITPNAREQAQPADKDRLTELRGLIKTHGFDESGLARLTVKERDEFATLGGDPNELIQ